jgi:alkylated DNA repair protein (DNA oxidative demethylase)
VQILKPRPDFIIVKDYFTPVQASKWIELILKKGTDPVRGFSHPDLKPNRFHPTPKYPVKNFMCMGFYWNPLNYSYLKYLPDHTSKPWPIPASLRGFCSSVLETYFPWNKYSPETVLVNYYDSKSAMGLHVDKDEQDHKSPVIGMSFGSTCRFFYENENGLISDVKIPGNSVYVFGKSARLMRHGVGTLYSNTLSAGSEQYLKNKERISLTIRQVYH